MDWKERVAHYREGGTSAPMKSEDLAARAIAAGLCGSGSKLRKLAGRLGVLNDDDTEFETAMKVLDSVSGGMFHPMSASRRYVLDVRQENGKGLCWSDDDELEDLCDIAGSMPDGMIVVCRRESASGPKCDSFVFLPDIEPTKSYVLRPVAALIAHRAGVHVWKRDTKRLFSDMRECLGWEIPEV